MKTIKKIRLGNPFTPEQMSHLTGGSNINDAAYCSCTGSTDKDKWCTNNSNSGPGCKCVGVDDNVNYQIGCSCGS